MQILCFSGKTTTHQTATCWAQNNVKGTNSFLMTNPEMALDEALRNAAIPTLTINDSWT